ncbi:HipA domain-containing protein [Fodinicurvata sp. EGI_FJ10296]|uniref:type II toxin-antitoxin system HipA family toxin n=1 Tax=Fodinicurvata sp. EGI_FJ10296 TaxID=3231908 RepID=UPI00345388F9
MTSDAGPAECFVYITLPGQIEPVTAGRLALTSDRHGAAIGRFVYGRSYRERPDAVEFDPVELKLTSRTYETTAMNGVFGALRDAGPDYWGRRVIERYVGRAQLGELDYLLHSPDDRAGALGFGLGPRPPAPRRNFNQTLDLAKLQSIANAIVNEEEVEPNAVAGQVEELLFIGTSMGGARPKVVVEDGEGLWIAKFNRTDDKWNYARAEHSMLVLARQCGLMTAESKVATIAGRDVLLIKRFDREKTDTGYLRARMVSGLTLLRAEDSHRSRDRWSYVLLAEELRRACTEPKKQANELFRRMCFNALVSNTDDHPRNHAVIATDRDWKLSPAYDITPSTPVSLEQRDLALICGDQGRFANADNLLSQSERFFLARPEAEAIVTEMEQRVRNTWYAVMRAAGVSERDCDLLKGAFAYPGFRQTRE